MDIYLPTKKNSRPDITEEVYQTFKEVINYSSSQTLVKKLNRREHIQIHSLRVALPWYQNQIKKLPENYRLISLMNINAKTFNETLANYIEKHI